MDVNKLAGTELDVAVAIADGYPAEMRDGCVFFRGEWNRSVWYSPSEDWREGGPIIEREGITIQKMDYVELDRTDWQASLDHFLRTAYAGPTPLVAAMRAFVASKQVEKRA
jgi:hypothetical protein